MCEPRRIKRSGDTVKRVAQTTVILCTHFENPSGVYSERGKGNCERNANVRKENVGVMGNGLSVELSFLPHYSLLQGVKCCADVVRCSYSPSFMCVAKQRWFPARWGAREFRMMSESDQNEDKSKRVDMFAVTPTEIHLVSGSARQLGLPHQVGNELMNQYRCTVR